LLHAIGPDRRLIIEALTITAWNETGAEADRVLRECVAQAWPEPEPPAERTSAFEIVIDDDDETYRAAHGRSLHASRPNWSRYRIGDQAAIWSTQSCWPRGVGRW
jgi:hypothetical protein